MIDYFAVLGLERRPAIDENALKEIYFRKSATREGDSALLNEAFRTLQKPGLRIQHLLKLEFGEVGAKHVGSGLEQMFSRVAAALRKADEAVNSFSGKESPLLRALAYQGTRAATEELDQIATEIGTREAGLLSAIKQLDGHWAESKKACHDSLAQVAFELTFIQKWMDQIRERKLRLEGV